MLKAYGRTLLILLCAALCAAAVLVLPSYPPEYAFAAAAEDMIASAAESIISWKKSDVGAEEDGFLINDNFLKQAGSTPGDWFPIGLGRLGIADNQEGYLAVINDNVQKRYLTADKLDRAKATEWHRISLAVLASGGNPRRMGENGDIDLIADGTYNRIDGNGNGILGKQGINGYIWGLITLDSMYYEIPEDAYYSRDDIILQILKLQLPDGGWALTGEVSDPDITAMAVQSLAPYYNSEKEYGGVKVCGAVNRAVDWLSSVQLSGGDFYSWGMPNCESTVQVTVALCSIGIDIFGDERFIKQENGKYNTLIDGIMKYRTQSGGFTHSYVNDADNPSAVAGEPNTMASEQTLYGLCAVLRFMKGERRLYDFRAEQSEEVKARIAAAENSIAALSYTSPSADIRSAYGDYLEVDAGERSYVKNYRYLSELLEFAGIPFEKEEIDYNNGDAGITVPTEYFDYSDCLAAESLPAQLTTAYRAEVLRLWSKLRNSVEFDRKQEMTVLLEKAKNEIDRIQDEIDAIRSEIKQKLYPFDDIGLGDREVIYDLYERYNNLSEYDRAQIEAADIEGLIKSKTQVDNLRTALIVGICCGVAVAVITAGVVLHIVTRRKKKKLSVMAESDE